MEFKSISQIVTTVAAFIGMGLSIYNLFVERSKSKVKILVQPKSIIHRVRNSETGTEGFITSKENFNCQNIDAYFAIEAINISTFPVTIKAVGFEVRRQKNRMVIGHPVIIDNGNWPRRLEPRESVTMYGLLNDIVNNTGAANINNAFVETSCGSTCRGTSGALIELIKYVRQLQHC